MAAATTLSLIYAALCGTAVGELGGPGTLVSVEITHGISLICLRSLSAERSSAPHRSARHLSDNENLPNT